MEFSSDKVRSLIEAVAILNKLGSPIPGVPGPTSFAEVWGAVANPLAPATIRDMRDFIAQCIMEVLSDSDSLGTSISVPGTFGGGNRIPGLGNVKITATTGKKINFFAGTYGLEISPTEIKIISDSGSHWTDLFSTGGGGIDWDSLSVYSIYSWVAYQGKLYKSQQNGNLNHTPGNLLDPGWWLVFAEQVGIYFELPNTILGTVPDGSITNIKVAADAAIDATKIADGSVDNTEFQSLDGVSSNIQDQLDNKVEDTDPRLDDERTPLDDSVTNAKIPAGAGIDASKIGGGDVSTTEFNFLNGVTSGIQGQLNAKAADADVVHDTGDETVAGIKTFSSFSITPSSAPTSNYQVANKKYVDDSAAGMIPTTTITGDHNVISTDKIILANAVSNNITIYLQPAATAGNGKELFIKRIDNSSYSLIIDGDGTETIDGELTISLVNQWNGTKIASNGNNWFIIG